MSEGVLPSYSEGFPKVIAEAMNFGCIPIVSDISCIRQYIINGKNGFLINQTPTDSRFFKSVYKRNLKNLVRQISPLG